MWILYIVIGLALLGAILFAVSAIGFVFWLLRKWILGIKHG